MEQKFSLQEIYPHLFMNDARSMVSAMLKVDEEAARIKNKAQNRETTPVEALSLEEKKAIAFACIENSKKSAKEKEKLDQARLQQKKNLCEYDPRIGIEERHAKVSEKRQTRIKKTDAEAQLEELRLKREHLLEEISPEDLEKVKLEVKKSAEEVRLKDLAAKKQIKDIKEKEKIAKQKEDLRLEMEKKQRMMLEHRVNVLVKKISSALNEKKKYETHSAFKKINTYAIVLNAKVLKISRKNRFKRILRFFHLWHSVALKMKLDEENEVFQAEQERIAYLYQIAVKNYEFWLKRKALEGFAKYLYLVNVERQQQMEAVRRRKQFENFMNFVKQRTEDNEIKKQKELEREELEREMRRNAMINELELARREEKEKVLMLNPEEIINANFERRNPVPKPEKNDAETFTETAEVISPSVKTEEVSMKNEENAQKALEEAKVLEDQEKISMEAMKKTPKPSKEFMKMQQRQEERRLKREALEAKYKEKKEKEEQEKREAALKAQEEEKKKKKEVIEKRKQEERLKKELEERKKKENLDLQEKMIIAKSHYDDVLSRKVLEKWVEYHYAWQKNLIKAEVFHDRSIKKFAWDVFKEGLKLAKAESLQLEKKRLEWANNHYLHVLKQRSFKVLTELIKELIKRDSEICTVRPNFLKKLIFHKWLETIPDLIDENYEKTKQEDELIYKFRCAFLVPKLLQAWKSFVQESKEDKLKELYTQAMWEKAQQWLSESSPP